MENIEDETTGSKASISGGLLAPVLVVPEDTPQAILDAALAAGYIPIPTKAPGYVQLLTGSHRWSGDDLLMAALGALQGANATHERSDMVKRLWDRIKDRGANP